MKMETYQTALNDGTTKVQELYTHVKRYCLHKALSELGIVSMKIFGRDQSVSHLFPASINEWQLAFLAKALILNSNDHRNENFGDKGLLRSASLFNNLYEPFIDIEDNGTPNEKSSAISSFLLRIANQQFPFQIKVGYFIPRALYLFHEIPRSLKNPSLNLLSEIEETYGLTTKQIITVGFAIFASSKHGYFDPQYLINTNSPSLQKHLDPVFVERLVDSLTADYYQLRDLFTADEEADGFQQYSFNSLRTYPLVKTQIAGLVVPVPRFVLERITNGIYYSLMDKFRTNKSNKFLEFFGKEIFERYIGILLSEIYIERLVKEFDYKDGKKVKKSPDWIVIEGEEAILVECKTSGITKEAKSLGDLEKVQSDLRSRAIHGIIQMNMFEKDFRAGLIDKDELKDIKRFNYVVVTYDRVFMSGTPTIRSLVDRELLANGLRDIQYQIIGVDEMEKVTPLLKKITFSELLKEKMLKVEWATYDFDVYLSSFLKERGIEIDRENKLLRDKYESFMKEISPELSLRKSA